MTVLDIFAGPGGWDLGAAQAGNLQPVGIELNGDACLTRHAAGLLTVRQDVRTVRVPKGLQGLIASPPCTAFSDAGRKQGRDWLPLLHSAARSFTESSAPWPHDVNIGLVLEPLRFALVGVPEWIALEQVPPVLGLWETFASVLSANGWSCWTGLLNAADFGVPQTRQRAFLLAHRRKVAQPPEPTHCRGGADTMFGQLAPWVSMADALGWDEGTRLGFPRKDDMGDSPDGYRERDWREGDEPSFALTAKARSWQLNTGRDWKKGGTREDAQTIPVSQPSPALDAAKYGAGRWWWTEPTSESVPLTVEDALVLQSFPKDFPLVGTNTSKFRQIGDAVPPLLAAAVLGALHV